nr:hypothetical protein Iba_chr11eCG11510 [Ipomoea batatas]
MILEYEASKPAFFVVRQQERRGCSGGGAWWRRRKEREPAAGGHRLRQRSVVAVALRWWLVCSDRSGVSLLQEKKDYSVFNLSIPLLLPLIYAFGITSLPHYIAAAALFAYSVAAATSPVIASIRGRRSSSFGRLCIGRTSKPVSPKPPPSCSATATIMGKGRHQTYFTWLATSRRALAFSFFAKADSEPPEIEERTCMATALKANNIACRTLQNTSLLSTNFPE